MGCCREVGIYRDCGDVVVATKYSLEKMWNPTSRGRECVVLDIP